MLGLPRSEAERKIPLVSWSRKYRETSSPCCRIAPRRLYLLGIILKGTMKVGRDESGKERGINEGATRNYFKHLFFQAEAALFQAAGMAMWKDMPVVRIYRYCSLSLEMSWFPWRASYRTSPADRYLAE